jgi:hypothetical protein
MIAMARVMAIACTAADRLFKVDPDIIDFQEKIRGASFFRMNTLVMSLKPYCFV